MALTLPVLNPHPLQGNTGLIFLYLNSASENTLYTTLKIHLVPCFKPRGKQYKTFVVPMEKYKRPFSILCKDKLCFNLVKTLCLVLKFTQVC